MFVIYTRDRQKPAPDSSVGSLSESCWSDHLGSLQTDA